jgi:hypothetical protein
VSVAGRGLASPLTATHLVLPGPCVLEPVPFGAQLSLQQAGELERGLRHGGLPRAPEGFTLQTVKLSGACSVLRRRS